MRCIVAGPRYYKNQDFIYRKLDKLFINQQPDVIIWGGAKGVDSVGGNYAKDRYISDLRMDADWDTYGKAAGYRRNVQMAEAATHAVVFYDGFSKGSGHMIDIAKRHKLCLRVVWIPEHERIRKPT